MGHGGGQARLLQPTHTRRLLPVLPLLCVPPARGQLLPWLPEVVAVPCDPRAQNGDWDGYRHGHGEGDGDSNGNGDRDQDGMRPHQ